MPNSIYSIPKIMGIMNVTPDSFYSASRINVNQFINYKQFKYADIIDIGAESTRPGAKTIKPEIELSLIHI